MATRTKSSSPKKLREGPSTRVDTIDGYLASLDPDKRALLQRLREQIRDLVPDAEECISYAMPAFRWNGKVVGGFAATLKGGSYYPFSGSTFTTVAEDLKGFGQTKSALHFTADKPIPQDLLQKLIAARKAEISNPSMGH